MPTWNSNQYLKFAAERSRPADDLIARIEIPSPRTIVDLGCGPGNSTALLAKRWPESKLLGIDSSAAMIEAASQSSATIQWSVGDIATWRSTTPVDLVFSNAALQWVPDHARVLPGLMAQVAADGAFAFQVPANFGAPAHRIMRDLGGSPKWRDHFHAGVREWHVEEPPFYYDILSPLAARLEMWLTEYQHILPGPAAIVEWYKGTGLRPWLDALPDAATREKFTADYLQEIEKAFPPQADGCVLFPFLRLFVIAYR